jgi:hypothetical protein
MDSDLAPSAWRLVVSLWVTGGGGGESADCELQVTGTGGTDSGNVAEYGTSESVTEVEIDPISYSNCPQDELLTVNIRLKATGGGTAHIKYTDLYAIYT